MGRIITCDDLFKERDKALEEQERIREEIVGIIKHLAIFSVVMQESINCLKTMLEEGEEI